MFSTAFIFLFIAIMASHKISHWKLFPRPRIITTSRWWVICISLNMAIAVFCNCNSKSCNGRYWSSNNSICTCPNLSCVLPSHLPCVLWRHPHHHHRPVVTPSPQHPPLVKWCSRPQPVLIKRCVTVWMKIVWTSLARPPLPPHPPPHLHLTLKLLTPPHL